MPAAKDLCGDLKFLSRLNALPIRNDPDFARDAESLVASISRRSQRLVIAALFAVLFFLLGTSAGFSVGRITSNPSKQPDNQERTPIERSVKPPQPPPVGEPEASEPVQQRVRIALAIGNRSYTNQTRLANSANDATAVAECLQSKGFRLLPLQIDKSTDEIRAALEQFRTLLALGGTGIVFYSGHGVQMDGENFIIPIDSSVTSLEGVRQTCINVSEIMGPIDKILQDTPERSGDLVIFATASGRIALDGLPSENQSPFTKCFIEAAAVEDYEIFGLFRYLCKHLPKITDGKQIPWMSVSTDVEFFLNDRTKDRDIGIYKMLIFDTCRTNPFCRNRLSGGLACQPGEQITNACTGVADPGGIRWMRHWRRPGDAGSLK